MPSRRVAGYRQLQPSSTTITHELRRRSRPSAASISQIFRRCAFLGARGDSLVKVLTADGLQPSLVTFDGCRIDTGVNSARYGVYVKGRPGLTVRFENCMIAGGSGAGDGGGAKALIYANGGFIQIWACTLQNNKIASGSVPTGPDGEEIYLDVPQSMSDATNVNPGPSLTAMHCESQGPRFLARRFQRLLADGSGANAVSARNAPQNVVLINCNHADTLSGLLAANATKAGRPLPPMDPTPGSIFWEGGSIEEAGITYQESAASRLILMACRFGVPVVLSSGSEKVLSLGSIFRLTTPAPYVDMGVYAHTLSDPTQASNVVDPFRSSMTTINK